MNRPNFFIVGAPKCGTTALSEYLRTHAHVAGAWVMLQVMDVLAEPLSLSAPLQLGVVIVVAAGFFVALILAWYHGEKGGLQCHK